LVQNIVATANERITCVRTAVLVGVGGVLYSIGVGFHIWRALPFQKAIWHSFVLVAASFHYAAVLRGVVLARS
jgi:channel protein (hemolysin III family)